MEHLNMTLLKALTDVSGEIKFKTSIHVEALLGVTIDGKIGFMFKLQVVLGAQTKMGTAWSRIPSNDVSEIQEKIESKLATVCWNTIAEIHSVNVEGSVCAVVDGQQILIMHINKTCMNKQTDNLASVIPAASMDVDISTCVGNSEKNGYEEPDLQTAGPTMNVPQDFYYNLNDTENCENMNKPFETNLPSEVQYQSDNISIEQTESLSLEKVDEAHLESEVITDVIPMQTVENNTYNIGASLPLSGITSNQDNTDVEIESVRNIKKKYSENGAKQANNLSDVVTIVPPETAVDKLRCENFDNVIHTSSNHTKIPEETSPVTASWMNIPGEDEMILVIMPETKQVVPKLFGENLVAVDTNDTVKDDMQSLSDLARLVDMQDNMLEPSTSCNNSHSGESNNDYQGDGLEPDLDNSDPNIESKDCEQQVIPDDEYAIKKAADTNALLDTISSGKGNDEQTQEPITDKTVEIIISCHDCGIKFDDESQLIQHISKRACEFKCGHCTSKFSSRQQLQNHIRQHMQILPFSCNMCSKEFLNIKLLREHKNIHKVDKLSNLVLNKLIDLQGDRMKYQRKCFICGKIFTSYFNLKRHLLQHKSSGKEATLKVLEQVQKGESHFGMLFFEKVKSLSELALNALAIPVPRKKNEFKCKICKKEKFTHFNLKRHLQFHFDNRTNNTKGKGRKYKCNNCGQSFKSTSLRDLHQEQIHERGVKLTKIKRKQKRNKKQQKEQTKEDNVLFTCKFCEKEFASLSNLEKHVDLHKYHQMRGTSGNGIRRYKCSECPNSYSSKEKLTQHINLVHMKLELKKEQLVDEHGYVKDLENINKQKDKVNLNPNLHQCKYCSRTCQNAYNLGRHEKLHEKSNARLRPFSCQHCHKTYAFQNNLRLHVLEEHKNVVSVDENVILEEKKQILQDKSAHVSLVCQYCGERCSTSFNLKRHEKRRHSGNSVKRGRKCKKQ